MVFRCMRLARLIGQGDADTWRNEFQVQELAGGKRLTVEGRV